MKLVKYFMGNIYQIRNTLNGNFYIGSTRDAKARWARHRFELQRGTHHSPALQAAWAKYGPDSFEFLILETCPTDSLIEREQAYIDDLSPAYNAAAVAGKRTFAGRKHRPETIEKMSAAKRGNTHTKGKQRSRDAVEKTAAAHRGRKRSAQTRSKLCAARAGKAMPPRSAEHRAKLSAALKGKPKSAAHLAALQDGRRRRIYTPEQRAAIAERSRQMWALRKA